MVADGGPDAGLSGSDCTSSADCGGQPCLEVTPGGFRTCFVDLEATSCTGGADACCTSSDCTTGICALLPTKPYCGGIFPGGFNGCVSDECELDGDCGAGGLCLPAGVLQRPVRTCIQADCRTDADCTDAAGGRCVPVTSTCCTGPAALACAYPSDGCRSDADCTGSDVCGIEAGRASCVSGPVACPL